MPMKVLTITMNPSVDIGTEAKEVVTDQKTRCKHPVYDPGGGGINVARVLTRLGINTGALFIAGGYTGTLLQQMMEEENLTSIPIHTTDVTRQNIAIIDNSSGKQFRFVLPGVVSDESTWRELLLILQNSISEVDFVVASGSLPAGVPVNFYSRVGEIVKKAGKKYLLDTSGPALFEGIKNGATYIKPNQEEFNEMMRIFNAQNKEDLCTQLFNQGVEHIVHTLGKDETLLISANSVSSFKPPAIKVRSTIGAGDSFIGGLIAGLVRGLTQEKAVGFGISAAASTLQSEGTDLCDPHEVEEIFNQNFA